MFESLKEGDEVAVFGSYGARARIARVAKVTATIVRLPTSNYRRDTGRQITSDRWGQNRIAPLTDEIKATIRHDELVERLHRQNWDALALDKLESVAAIVLNGAVK